jgi:hypothetical protein
MKLIKFPLSNTKGKEFSLPNNPKLTDGIENVITSLPYQDWEIEEIIENFSENEQDMLIEKISDQVQEWELTLDGKLELWLRTKHKESKSNLSYIDFLYDLAQEQVYRTYAIEKLNKQKNKASLVDVDSNNSVNDKPISLAASNTQTATTTAATSTDVLADQTTNNNSLLDYEEQINQIIANLSEAQQDVLMEKTVLLLDEWESARDAGLELALRTQHQKHQPHISYQDFLYELAQSQVYREYAIEQLELAKQNNAKFIGQFVEIEKVYCDKLTNAHVGNVDEPIFDELIFNEPIFDSASQAAKDEDSVQLLDANNEIIINDELTANSNSDTRENAILCDVSQLANETAANEKNLDCHQATSNSQGHQERLTSLKDCANYHTIKALLNYSSKFPIKHINQQTSSFSSTSYGWANSLLLTKAKKALLMHIHQGKPASIYHPPSLPP